MHLRRIFLLLLSKRRFGGNDNDWYAIIGLKILILNSGGLQILPNDQTSQILPNDQTSQIHSNDEFEFCLDEDLFMGLMESTPPCPLLSNRGRWLQLLMTDGGITRRTRFASLPSQWLDKKIATDIGKEGKNH